MLSCAPRRPQRRCSSRTVVVGALMLACGTGAGTSIAHAQSGDPPRSHHGVKKNKRHHGKQFSHEGRAPGAGHTASISGSRWLT